MLNAGNAATAPRVSASELNLAAAGWQHMYTMIEVKVKTSCESTACT